MSRRDKYGLDLAMKTAEYLKVHGSIKNNHYGYCGVGFVASDGIIIYTHFDEFLCYTRGEWYVPGGEYEGIIKMFETEDAFVNWLADQSDSSMSGKETNDGWYIDNQRITRKRLLHAIDSKNAQRTAEIRFGKKKSVA